MHWKLNTWKTSYQKEHQIGVMRKLEKDRRNKIMLDNITKFKNFQIFSQAVTLIGTYDGLQKCSKNSFVLLRNLVMTEILIDNSQRGGVLFDMTMEEFESTKRITDDDSITTYCLTVMHHNVERAGPIWVMMSPKLYSWLDILRPKSWKMGNQRSSAKFKSVLNQARREFPLFRRCKCANRLLVATPKYFLV